MLAVNILIAVALAIAIILFFVGYIVFRRICVRRRNRPDGFDGLFSENRLKMATEERLRRDYDWFDEHRTRDICVSSIDGLRLFATLIEASQNSEPKGVVLLFHGYRSNARRDFCMHARILHEAGYHIILADQRSHSRSEGKYICYGIKERYDVITWREKAGELFGNDMPIAFMGLSMGGATVLMASELVKKEDAAVRCVIADCPFSSPKGIILHVMKNHNKLPFAPLLLAFAGFWTRTLADFTLSAPSSAELYERSHLPALLIHGDGDDYVPIGHSKEIVDLPRENARLVTVHNATHANAIYYDEEKYTSELLSFLGEKMKR